MSNIARAYINGTHKGWLGRDLALAQFDVLGGTHFKLNVVGKSYAGKRMMLYEIVRKVYGKDPENVPQETGDCTSWGAKHAVEDCQAADILLKGEAEKFSLLFAPYFYGCSRVLIGGGRMWGDGSTGIWTAKAANKYGALVEDLPGVPKYSGSVAKDWGRSGPPQEFLSIGKLHLVKTIAKINSWADAVEAICNGCAVTLASNQGFEMQASSDGFHHPRGTWNHQMELCGVNDGASQGSYGIIKNSWGPDAMGHLKDFDTGEDIPAGCLRVRAEVIDSMIKQDDSWAFSAWEGFPDNNALLEEKLFDVIGS